MGPEMEKLRQRACRAEAKQAGHQGAPGRRGPLGGEAQCPGEGDPGRECRRALGGQNLGSTAPTEGVCTDHTLSLKGLEDPLTQHGQEEWRAKGQRGVTLWGSGSLLLEGLPFL